ncbi:rod shape-determining protein [Carbonactinospora thermoautotrophica]|uniref:Cell shape-determining protein MreB n=1 Tax=Carbonactinospora thermoautotrophica TaxID=1469144 RepID=A0A132NJZ2_9ACTN|nr:rod shape-determining protein [Carbonactinospora thermoautotrophica]KWX04136.1 rod shape-determining protein MreB [Carbonactinospora thermoautotrophica]KWX10277.1 rod shape-determining protein MreB [Carbonactinospora thermoautotrophica]MCX9192450.1 rod shape-determining protein [Carbonactinospora thermoautotrophica]
MGDLGVDLGTTNTVVCHNRRGVILNEPSVMALRAHRGRPKVLAIGLEARALVGRVPAGLSVVRPLHDGVITDLETARMYLGTVLRRIGVRPWQRARLRAAIGVPMGATALERRALLEAAEEARIGKAMLIPEPIAGAAGCGLDPLEPRTHMVVDVGGGMAEVTAFCYEGLLAHRSCPLAGDEMTLAVYQYLREEYQIIVGELIAEQVKVRTTEDTAPIVVEGQDAATGRPRVVTLAPEEVLEAIRPVTDAVIRTLAACLEDLSAQSVSDVMAEGVLTIGGGSLLRGFDKLLEDAFGFPVRRAERPLTCVAEGAVRCLSRESLLKAYAAG